MPSGSVASSARVVLVWGDHPVPWSFCEPSGRGSLAGADAAQVQACGARSARANEITRIAVCMNRCGSGGFAFCRGGPRFRVPPSAADCRTEFSTSTGVGEPLGSCGGHACLRPLTSRKAAIPESTGRGGPHSLSVAPDIAHGDLSCTNRASGQESNAQIESGGVALAASHSAGAQRRLHARFGNAFPSTCRPRTIVVTQIVQAAWAAFHSRPPSVGGSPRQVGIQGVAVPPLPRHNQMERRPVEEDRSEVRGWCTHQVTPRGAA